MLERVIARLYIKGFVWKHFKRRLILAIETSSAENSHKCTFLRILAHYGSSVCMSEQSSQPFCLIYKENYYNSLMLGDFKDRQKRTWLQRFSALFQRKFCLVFAASTHLRKNLKRMVLFSCYVTLNPGWTFITDFTTECMYTLY